jgi:hypothetical protein
VGIIIYGKLCAMGDSASFFVAKEEEARSEFPGMLRLLAAATIY